MPETTQEPKKIYAPIEEVPLTKVVLWGLFLVLVASLRDFYPLFFLTFIFSFIAHNAADWFMRRHQGKYTRHQVITGMFLLVISAWVAMGFLFVPRIIAQASHQIQPEQIQRLTANLESMKKKPILEWVFAHYPFEEQVAKLQKYAGDRMIDFIKTVLNLGTQFLLALLFSFLITYDYEKFAAVVAKARETRLYAIYDEVAPEVREFGNVMGRTFQAQAIIACVNTCLTAVGMLLLGLPSVILLSMIVFFCSFIPVVGVIISSVPMCIVGLAMKDGGIGTVFGVIIMVALAHTIEAYVLNPRIMGHHMHMNPIIVLAILLFAEHFFGIWGLVLGVPVCYYFFNDVLKEMSWRRTQEETPPAAPPEAPPAPA